MAVRPLLPKVLEPEPEDDGVPRLMVTVSVPELVKPLPATIDLTASAEMPTHAVPL